MHSSTVARLVDVPASGKRLKAILPNGHSKSFVNAGVEIMEDGSVVTVAANAMFGFDEMPVPVDAAAIKLGKEPTLERKFLLLLSLS